MANVHAEQEVAVARCRFLEAAALDNVSVQVPKRCERLQECFIRERDCVAVAEFVLADGEPSCGKSRPWSLNDKTRYLACRPRMTSLSSRESTHQM